MYKEFLIRIILCCSIVFSAKILQEWEYVSTHNDLDYNKYVLWKSSGQSSKVCGSMCTHEIQCMSYIWNVYNLTCKSFYKIFVSTSPTMVYGNRYYRRINNFSSNGYSTSPPLPITPIIFQFHTEPLNANAALAECQKTFGHMIGTLLRIRNQETADYMAEYLKNAEASNDVLIDGYDEYDNNVWRYSDGLRITYFRWAMLEPSSIFGNERCLTLQNKVPIFLQYFEKMNNRPCSESFPYICQLDIYASD